MDALLQQLGDGELSTIAVTVAAGGGIVFLISKLCFGGSGSAAAGGANAAKEGASSKAKKKKRAAAKKKKKSAKKSGDGSSSNGNGNGSRGSGGSAAAPAPAAPAAAAPAAAPAAAKKKRKRKKKKKAAPAPAPVAAADDSDADSDVSSDEGASQEAAASAQQDDAEAAAARKAAARAQRKAEKKAFKKAEAAARKKAEAAGGDGGGWAVAGKKEAEKRKKRNARKADAAARALAAGPSATVKMEVPARKIGVIIGPKGVTLNKIRDATGCEIEMPERGAGGDNAETAFVTLSGDAAGVDGARQAIKDLVKKGYCSYTVGDDFQESTVSVHSSRFPDLIGSGGAVIKALQAATGARLNMPGDSRGANKNMQVRVSGPKASVQAAKDAIRSIVQYYHSTATHPGFAHEEIDVAQEMFGHLIGPKGATLNHINNNFSVAVHIPRDSSANKNVVVTGLPVNVAKAAAHIRKKVADVQKREEEFKNATGVTPAAAGGNLGAAAAAAAAEAAEAQEGQEAWMEGYSRPAGWGGADEVAGDAAAAPSAGDWGGGAATEGAW